MEDILSYDENKDEKRINTDEMVARLGAWEDKNLQIQCGKGAVKLIKHLKKSKKRLLLGLIDIVLI